MLFLCIVKRKSYPERKSKQNKQWKINKLKMVRWGGRGGGGTTLVDNRAKKTNKEKMNVFFIVIKYHLLFRSRFYQKSAKNTPNAEANGNFDCIFFYPYGHSAWGCRRGSSMSSNRQTATT